MIYTGIHKKCSEKLRSTFGNMLRLLQKFKIDIEYHDTVFPNKNDLCIYDYLQGCAKEF